MRWLKPFCVLLAAVVLHPSAFAADEEAGPLAGHSYHGEAFNEGPRQAAYLMKGTGKVRFPVTTKVRQAQLFFNQGVGQLHGFWYFEAERSFRQAATLDPDLAMAYWGMALANTKNADRAKKLITEAVKRKDNASARERLWIDAWANYYKEGKREEKDRRRDLVKALEKIIFEYPDDIEAKAFLAVQIWENSSRGLPISSHQSVESLIREVLAEEPMHPAHHYRIHLWDAEKAERALNSAALCGQSTPGIAHMWHMPGHIFSKLHRYADAAWQQEASARVDHAQMMRDRLMPDQIHNYAHNNEWLVRNLSCVGRAHDAIDLAMNMIELPRLLPKTKPSDDKASGEDKPVEKTESAEDPERKETAYVDSSKSSYAFGRLRLIEVLSRYELWDELIRAAQNGALDPGPTPQDKARYFRALGVAHFSRGDAQPGKRMLESLECLLAEEADKLKPPADEKPVADAGDAGEKKDAGEEKDSTNEKKDSTPAGKKDSVQEEKKTDKKLQFIETAIAELKGYAALANRDHEAALEHFGKAKDIPKDRLARLQFEAGEKEKAEQTARDAVKSATNQVQVLANYIDILQRAGKTDAARKEFQKLLEISADIDLDMPVFQRLQAVAVALNLPADWRVKSKVAKDAGKRPDLDKLGPFRWEPSPAPDWTLVGMNGARVSLKDFRGRPVIVIFYLGHGCPHCIEQLNAFAPVAEKFRQQGIALVAVSTDTAEGLRRTFDQSRSGGGFPFPLVSDASLKIFKAYRAFDDFESIPLHGTFLIDGAGRVRWQDISYEPFMETEFLLEESARLLNLPRGGFSAAAAASASPSRAR